MDRRDHGPAVFAGERGGWGRFEKRGSGPFFFEMGITRAEFLRLLPVAVGHAAWRIDGDEIVAEGNAPAWRIRLREMPGRPFGAVTLPVLGVTLALDGDPDAFVARFLLGYQRAGG